MKKRNQESKEIKQQFYNKLIKRTSQIWVVKTYIKNNVIILDNFIFSLQ